jgi:hypothetical protein
MTDTHAATASAAPAGNVQAKKGPPFTPKPPFFFELSRLMVVAIKGGINGQLVYRAQTKPNGPWEANWTPIERTQTFNAMAAGRTGDGRVAVVAQPTSNAGVLYIDEKEDTLNQDWNAPVNLGKPPGVTQFHFLATAYDTDGRVEVFGTDSSQGIWWKYQNPKRVVQKTVTITPPGTKTPITVTVDELAPPLTPWSDWFRLPGGLGQIKALRNADGRIILFGTNPGNNLYRSEQRIPRATQPGDWTGWVQMDNPVSGKIQLRTMAPARDGAGAVNLFVIGFASHQIYHTRQSPPGAQTWTGWSTPGLIRDGMQMVAAGIDGDDHLVVVGTDLKQFHNMTMQFDIEAQQWSSWIAFATGGPVWTALAYNADGRLTFFSHTITGMPPPNYGGLWCTSQMAFDSTEWELAWTELAADGIHDYAVVRDLTPPTG